MGSMALERRPNGEEGPPGDDATDAASASPTTDDLVGRADRDPDEGPALGGGSALDADDLAADEEVGGG